MAKIFYLQNEIVRLLKTKLEEDHHGEPSQFDGVIEFDETTNSEVILVLDTDWNNHSVVDGVLQYLGKSVTLSPPGYDWSTTALKPQIIESIKSLEGLSILDMDLAQLKKFLFALGFAARAINPADLTIRSPKDWVK